MTGGEEDGGGGSKGGWGNGEVDRGISERE